MDLKGEEEKDQMKSSSFRYEDYNNRRAFLRSYPLFWGGEDENGEEEGKESVKVEAAKETNSKKKNMKKFILAMFQWGGERVVIFRRFKHKVTLYVITCLPVGLKAPTHLISAK